jgi:hypothetical protein
MFSSLDYIDDGRGRPYSAPAVMAGDATGTPESETSVLEYVSNKGESQAGATNPRIPRSGLGARFSADQVGALRSSASALGALAAIGKRPSHADPLDDVGVAGDGLVRLSEEEIRRETQRRYRAEDTVDIPPAALLGMFEEDSGATSRAPAVPDHVDASVLKPAPHAGLFSRLADSHRRAIDTTSSTLRAAKSHATILSEQQRLLTKRSEAAVVMQRAVRQLLVGSCGVRLLALLHILRTEAAAPRYPMIVGRAVQSGERDSVVVTPLMYLLEVTLEYEYVLYVENVSRRLVVDTANAEAARQQSGGMRQYVRRAVLSGAEVSDLHDTVQQRLASGELVVSRFQLRRGVGSLLTAAGEAMWCAKVADAIAHRSSSALSRESFLHSIAQDVVLRQKAARNEPNLDDGVSSASGRPATPTWSYHSGTTIASQHNSTTQSSSSSASIARATAHRETLIDRCEEATWEQPQSSSDLRSRQQQLRMAAAYRASHIPLEGTEDVVALIKDTPQEWFAVGNRDVSRDALVDCAVGAASIDLSSMPLPSLALQAQPPTAPSPAALSDDTVESQLASLWAGHDPELAAQERRSKRLARRRILGAEDDGKSDSSDDAAHGNASAKVAFMEPTQLEFDSAAQRIDRERREKDLRKRIEAAVATSVALKAEALGASRFDPASWGLDETAASMRHAAVVLGVTAAGSSRSESRSSTATDASLRQVHKVVVRVGAASSAGGAPQECVICEMDAVDVQRCSCGGNWVHRECSFGFDVDAPVSKSAAVKCCRLCTPAVAV